MFENTYFHNPCSMETLIYGMVKGFDVNNINKNGQTFLHIYHYYNDKESEELYYKYNHRCHDECTDECKSRKPIFDYTLSNTENYLFIKILNDKKFNFMQRDIYGNTIFHINYLPNTLDYCIKNNKFDPSVYNNNRSTIFHSFPDYLYVILEHEKTNINFNFENENGETIIELFFKMKYKEHHVEILKMAVKNNLNLNKKDNAGNTIIHKLINNDYFMNDEFFDFIVNNGFIINSKNNNGDTVFHLFEIRPIVHKFNEFGFNPNIINNEGKTVFHLKSFSLNRIINSGIDLNILCNKGYSIFDRYYLNKDDIEELIKNGFDPNKQNKDGNTLLHRTIKECVARDLVKFTDLTIVNNNGETPLHCLVKNFKNISFLNE